MEKYIKTGKYIWCGKEKPQVTFYKTTYLTS